MACRMTRARDAGTCAPGPGCAGSRLRWPGWPRPRPRRGPRRRRRTGARARGGRGRRRSWRGRRPGRGRGSRPPGPRRGRVAAGISWQAVSSPERTSTIGTAAAVARRARATAEESNRCLRRRARGPGGAGSGRAPGSRPDGPPSGCLCGCRSSPSGCSSRCRSSPSGCPVCRPCGPASGRSSRLRSAFPSAPASRPSPPSRMPGRSATATGRVGGGGLTVWWAASSRGTAGRGRPSARSGRPGAVRRTGRGGPARRPRGRE